jgi:phosphoglycerate dehydrogenase-like enzyme
VSPASAERLVIVIADPSRQAYAQAAREALSQPGWEVRIASGFDEEELVAWAEDADVLVTRRRPIPGSFLERAGRLRSVQHIGGVPRPEVVSWAAERGVPLELTPSLGNLAVAEQALALLLAVTRRIVEGHRLTTSGAYRSRGLEPASTSEVHHAFQWMGLDGVRTLYGATVGVVGFGDIGRAFATRVASFGCQVIYTQRNRLDEATERALGVAYRTLDDLIATADVISLHVPHTAETERMIDGDALRAMKPGAILINAARGGLVDEAALVAALRSGHLAGAGLDVFAEEPVPYDHPLLAIDSVCVSPHLGSAPARGLGESMALLRPKLVQVARSVAR